MPKTKIVTGTSSFKEIVTESDAFIDKTLFIKDIINDGKKAILITRPRRWGKSLALDMLKTFLAVEVDEHGKEVDKNSNKVLFTGGEYAYHEGRSPKTKTLLKSKIAKSADNDLIENHQGAYPVIHITFRGPSDGTTVTYENTQYDIISRIQSAFEIHKYLAQSEKLDSTQKTKFDNCKNGLFAHSTSSAKENAKKVLLRDSLQFLTELLRVHHNKKVYVLVDEADKPVSCFLEQGLDYKVVERKKVITLVSSVLGACSKDNDMNLEKIILTGILDVFLRGANSGFNNLEVYGIGDTMFAQHFGFSEKEIKERLLIKLQKKTLTDEDETVAANNYEALTEDERNTIMKNIQAWYNGYRLPLLQKNYIEAYTPWAVMLYVSDLNEDPTKPPKEYWERSGVNLVLDKLTIPANTLDQLKDISEGKEITLTKPDKDFSSMLNNKEMLLTYLLFNSGYITSTEGNMYKLPNYEVMRHFKQSVLGQWLKQKLGQDIKLDDVASRLSENLDDKVKFFNMLQKDLLDKIKDGGDKSEAYFQSLVGGVIEYAYIYGKGAYHVLVEKTVGAGRIDNIFYPLSDQSEKPVIIHEYKMLDRTQESEVQLTLEQSIWQILEKGYLGEPLSKKKHHSSHHTWNSMEIRGMVFIKDETQGKWSVQMSDTFTLSIAQATQIRNFFASTEIQNSLDMKLGDKRKVEPTRKQLLAINKVTTLRELIEQKQVVVDQDSVQDVLSGTTITADAAVQIMMALSPAPEAKRSRSPNEDEGRAQLHTSYKMEGSNLAAVSNDDSDDNKRLLLRHNAADAGGNQLLSHQQPNHPWMAEHYITYYGSGINELLPLRVQASGVSDVAILQTSFLNENTISYLLDAALTKVQAGYSTIVLPLNIDGKHWVGLVIENNDNHLDITYLDSENGAMLLNAKEALSITCAQKGYQVAFSTIIVEEQKYGNCGPELVENFVMFLSGSRTTQEAAVPLHSLLYENSLLDPNSSALQIVENSRMIEQLSNRNTPLYRIGTLEPKVSTVIAYYESKPHEYNAASSSNTGFINLLQKTLGYGNSKLDSCFKYASSFFKSNAYTELQSLADKYDIGIKIIDMHSARSAYKKIAIKAHPDKADGNVDDFKLAKELSEQNTEISVDYNQIMSNLDKGHTVVRTVRTLTDAIKLYDEPEQVNIVSTLTNCGYLVESLASKSIGMKYFSGLAIGYQVYQGDFNGALTSTITMATYALPGLLMTTAPALAVTLKVGFLAYDAYYATTELYDVLPAIDLAGETNPFGNAEI